MMTVAKAIFESHITDALVLLVIGVLAYIVLIQYLNKEKKQQRKRISSLLKEREETPTMKKKYPFLRYADPSYLKQEAKKYEVDFDKRMYLTHFITGTAIGAILFIVYLKPFIFLIPLACLGGVVATLIKLHAIKRDYIQQTDFKLSVYMSSLTSAFGTFGNLRQSLENVIPMLEDPIRTDVEKAFTILEDGKSVRQAFHHMNEKYPQMVVQLFHEQLEVLNESGTSDIAKLRTVANQMKGKEVFKRQLATVHRSQFKVWRSFALMTYSLPFVFILISYDNYVTIMGNPIASIVFVAVTAYTLYIYKQLAKIEIYDPTEPLNN